MKTKGEIALKLSLRMMEKDFIPLTNPALAALTKDLEGNRAFCFDPQKVAECYNTIFKTIQTDAVGTARK